MANINIIEYNNLVTEYETNYKNYITHIFNKRNAEAITAKNQLIITNNLLQNKVIEFSTLINQQKTQIDTLENEVSEKETEYNNKRNLLDNKYVEQTVKEEGTKS